MTSSCAGLLIIRAWAESGSSSPLRAQIRLTRDVSHGFERSLTVAEIEAVIATVQAWLPEVLAESLPVEDNPDPLRRGQLAAECGHEVFQTPGVASARPDATASASAA